MNPQSNEQAGINLPPPIAEQAAAPGQSGEQGTQQFEQLAARPEQAPAGVPGVPATQPFMPVPIAASPLPGAPMNDVVLTTNASTQTPANDGDLIEKEWVAKAKLIVERNREDPYQQSRELTVVKADYLNKRYNKPLKMSE